MLRISIIALCYNGGMQNLFSRLKTFFTSALQPSAESVIGVDIGSAYLKVVQLRRKAGKAVLETYGALALGPYGGTEIGRATHLPPHVLAEALRDLMREAHVTTRNGAFAIPFSSSLVTTITVPALPEKELAIAVPIEARRYVPVPISEVNLDWWIVPEEPSRTFFSGEEKVRLDRPEQSSVAGTAPRIEQWSREERGERGETPHQSAAADGTPVAERSSPQGAAGQASETREKGETGDSAEALAPSNTQKILIAAIHNEAVTRFETIAKGAGIAASFFEVELFSAMRALFPEDLNAHAVLDMGAGESKLYIIDRGLLRLSHSINRGAQDLTLALSRNLGVSVGEAEKLKRRVGLNERVAGGSVAQTVRGLLDAVFAETNQALKSFARRYGGGVSDLILAGGGANLPGLLSFAKTASALPATLADPFSRVEAPAFLDAVLKAVGPEFSVALGVAFRKLQEAG